MRRYLLVAVWPAGIAAITAATVVALRRGRAPAGPPQTGSPTGHPAPPAADEGPGTSTADAGIPADRGLHSPAPDAPVPDAAALDGAGLGSTGLGSTGLGAAVLDSTGLDSTGLDTAEPGSAGLGAAGLGAAGLGSAAPDRPDRPGRALPGWLPGLVKLGAISTAGGLLGYELMVLVGRPIVKYGPRIDVPIMEWTSSHQVEPWAAILERLNKIANTWTTWGACGAAAACLATTWRTRKWLPPSVLGAAIVVDHYVTLALRRNFRRPGPPDSPLGTYPSGGCDRVVLFSGLIANLLWREFSGSRRGRVIALGATSLLAFNAGYCREYLSKHWFTDVVTGLLYGGVLYAPFAAAIRLLAGPPARPGATVAIALRPEPDRPRPPGGASAGQREGAAAGVGEPVRARLATEHGH